MISLKVDLESTGAFSRVFIDYVRRRPELRSFCRDFPEVGNVGEQVLLKQFDPGKRHVLYEVLKNQYAGLVTEPLVTEHLEKLKDPFTFTVTTGHQLNLLGGPLFFIYKIMTTIKAARSLKEAYPQYDFVPIFWMATEDHDAAEIDHFHLFGRKYQWQTGQQGAVGRFSTEGLDKLYEELPEKFDIFREAYLAHKDLASASRYLVNKLFGKYGVVCLDADTHELKKLFKGVIASELLDRPSADLVRYTEEELEGKGYSGQAFVRDINLFWLDDNIRSRIVFEDGLYKVLNTDLAFTRQQIADLVESHPEKFSPNVILRPLYQESILPNVCYIGGPAEVAYWLQLKKVFDHYTVPFPLLLPRNFFLYINNQGADKLQKLDLSPSDLFASYDEIKAKYMLRFGEPITLDEETAQVDKLFGTITGKASDIDRSLEAYVQAEKQKVLKMIDHMEKKLKKAEEHKHEQALNSIRTLKDKLFPDRNLQERVENFMTFMANDPDFLDKIYSHTEAFDQVFNILVEQ